MSINPVLEVLAVFQLSSSPSSGTAAPVMAAFVVLASKFCAVRVSAFAFSHAKTRSSFFRAASRRRVNFARLTTWSSNLASQFLAAASVLRALLLERGRHRIAVRHGGRELALEMQRQDKRKTGMETEAEAEAEAEAEPKASASLLVRTRAGSTRLKQGC